MELKEGMYVRTLDGICKCVELRDDGIMTRFRNEDGNVYFTNDMMCNPSFSIFDLIQVGDYVNGYPVNYITNLGKEFGKRISFGDETCVVASKFSFDKVYIYEEDIKSIVTKEQFESMQYKVGE